jgi:hypothetical protein
MKLAGNLEKVSAFGCAGMRKASDCDHGLVLNLNNTVDIFGLLVFYFVQSFISEELAESTGKIAPQLANVLSHIIANEKRISEANKKILPNKLNDSICPFIEKQPAYIRHPLYFYIMKQYSNYQ